MDFCKVHDFRESQKIEEEGFERQDRFYIEHFGKLPTRIPWEEDMEFQRGDRDLKIEYFGEEIIVSEKNRTEDYTDTAFEIWSVFPNKTGWSMHSYAKLLCYFLPSSVMIVNMEDMVKILTENKISRQVGWYYDNHRYLDIWINGVFYFVPVIRAQNKSYSSICIAFTDEQLKQLGVRFKRII